jgi:hypothetical protein
MPAGTRAPRTRSAATGDTTAAKSQLKTADQTARVGKDSRVDVKHSGELTAPLVHTVVEEVDGEDVKTRVSEEFRLAQDVGIMPLMEWAASSDVDVASTDGLRAVFYVLKDVVHEDEWASFRKYARDNKVEATDLLDFANAALEALAGRPTGEPSGSSTG